MLKVNLPRNVEKRFKRWAENEGRAKILQQSVRALPLSAEERARIDGKGVPFEHRPLAHLAWSDAVAAGLDVKPGDLAEVLVDGSWRWAHVWNDALQAKGDRS